MDNNGKYTKYVSQRNTMQNIPDPRVRNRNDALESPPAKRQREMNNSKIIDNALVNMMMTDIHSELLENKTFEIYTKKLNPTYVLPDSKKMAGMIQEKYNIGKAVIKEKLQLVQSLALTIFIWLSIDNDTYISMNVHFFQNSKLCCLNIATSKLHRGYTSANIAKLIRNTLNEFNIYSKIVTIIVNNQTIKTAVEKFSEERIHHCIGHTINSVVNDCIDKDSSGGVEHHYLKNIRLIALLAKCRKIVSYFKNSSQASSKLKQVQNQNNLLELELVEDVSTNWYSTLYMIKRLIEVKTSLSILSNLLDDVLILNLDSNEWHILNDCLILLQVFEKFTTILSKEKYPTLSCLIPLIRGLQNAINLKKVSTDEGKHLKKFLIAVINKRLNLEEYENNRTASKATILDPRFKTMAFSTEKNAHYAKHCVIVELKKNHPFSFRTEKNQQPTQSTSQMRSNEYDEIWGPLDKQISETTSQQIHIDSPEEMLAKYMDMAYWERNRNPFDFWEQNKMLFPPLYEMAVKYLCIPATALPTERLFFQDGVVNQRRMKNVEQILLVNSCCENNLL